MDLCRLPGASSHGLVGMTEHYQNRIEASRYFVGLQTQHDGWDKWEFIKARGGASAGTLTWMGGWVKMGKPGE
jgi:hypothetical protein